MRLFRPLLSSATLAVAFAAAPTWSAAADATPSPSSSPALSNAPAAAATCAACHGAQGEGNASNGAARLAGQNAEYLAHALSMFKAHTRAGTVMQGVAAGLSEDDAKTLGAYYAALHASAMPTTGTPDAALVAEGRRLATVGAPDHGMAACSSCHGAAGQGVGVRFPALVGQPAAFTVERLHEFQAKGRSAPPPAGSMSAYSLHMDEAQIDAVAAYFATQPPP